MTRTWGEVRHIRSASIATTMGPGIKLELATTLALAST